MSSARYLTQEQARSFPAGSGGDAGVQNVKDAAACLRIAWELRGYLADAPTDDPQVAGLLADCDALERVASWIGNKLSLDSSVTIAAASGGGGRDGD